MAVNSNMRLISVLLCAVGTNANDIVGGQKAAEGISPEMTKHSSDKEYQYDKRPKVDVFHFNHPYPVVQDSSDYDADFVKDENSDNGAWKAQSEYDRLRHKLAQQKVEVAKAQEAIAEAEKAYKEALHREEVQKKARATTTEKPAAPVKEMKKILDKVNPFKRKPVKEPEVIAYPGNVKGATDDTQKAMDMLEECKKQLAEAREKLKNVMKELEAAKKAQKDTQATYEAVLKDAKNLEAGTLNDHKNAMSAEEQHAAARAAYLAQLTLVSKLEVDIKVAAEKVRTFRNAEDGSGGVYNTHKSSAARSSMAVLSAIAFMFAA